MNLKAFAYNQQTINQRQDGYINLTQMCLANNKRIDNFLRLKQTQEYISTLSRSLRCEVMVTVNGGNTENIGTWGHPSLAINLARWISADFAVWCDAHIFNLMTTGQTSLEIDPLEEMKLKLALLHAEKDVAIAKANISIAEKNLLDTRHYIVTALPEPVQQKILGYQVVEKKVVEKVVYKESEFLRDNSTINKTSLCKRYGILTKNGKPDYVRLNKILSTVDLPLTAWHEVKDIQSNKELKTEYLSLLDDAIVQDSRQLWIGE
jgi:KilA-N domain